VQRRAVLVVRRDVLAEPVDAAADEPDVGGDAIEVVGQDGVQAVVLASLDDQRQLRQPGPQGLAHRRLARCADAGHHRVSALVGPSGTRLPPRSGLPQIAVRWPSTATG
jgi:hypothetical protein